MILLANILSPFINYLIFVIYILLIVYTIIWILLDTHSTPKTANSSA